MDTDELRAWLSACRHDGLNSLSHVLGYAGLLLDDPAGHLTAEQRSYLERMQRRARQGAECWDLAMLFLELEAGEPVWEPRRLTDVVERATELLREAGAPEPARVGVPADLPLVRADAHLETALFYLLAPEAGRFTYIDNVPTTIEASLADLAIIRVLVRTGLSLPARRYPDPRRVVRPGTRFGAAELIVQHYGSRLKIQADEAGTAWVFELGAWAGDAK